MCGCHTLLVLNCFKCLPSVIRFTKCCTKAQRRSLRWSTSISNARTTWSSRVTRMRSPSYRGCRARNRLLNSTISKWCDYFFPLLLAITSCHTVFLKQFYVKFGCLLFLLQSPKRWKSENFECYFKDWKFIEVTVWSAGKVLEIFTKGHFCSFLTHNMKMYSHS